MHKGVILLVKATDKETAINLVNEFMEEYGDGDVWDWFKIGGRWTNMLAPAEQKKEWDEYAESLLKPDNVHGFIYQSAVDVAQPELQRKWTELGLFGRNPYTDHYSLPDEGNAYDVVPLSECLEKVKAYCADIEKEKAELWEKMLEAKKKEAEGVTYTSMGYLAKCYYHADYGNFNFDSNVYNISECEAETIPEDVTGYFAVMVDMHN